MKRFAPLVCALLLGAVLVAVVGCQSAPAQRKPKAPPPKPVTANEDFRGWPQNTLAAVEKSGTVERISEPDPENGRVASSHAVPDWANPTAPLTYTAPKGAKVSYFLMLREESLRAEDDETLANLLAGKKRENETAIFARPWRGWFGESGGTDGREEYRLRIYHLFRPNLHLEIHLEWPNGNKAALEEGETLLRHLVYSIDILKTSG